MTTSRRPPTGSDTARLWRTDELGGLELMEANYVSFVFTPHSHEEFLIALTEDGVGYPIFRRGSHPVGPGDVFVLNPEEPHAGGPASDAPWGYRAIYPSREFLSRIRREFSESGHVLTEFSADVVRDKGIAARLRRFHTVADRPDVSRLQKETRLLDALVSLIRKHGVRRSSLKPLGSENRAVNTAREFLDANAEHNVSLPALASIVGLSPYYLCRLFRQRVGLTPHAYQTQMRVRQAKELLTRGVPIAQSAIESGFYDQAHLTRQFKRVLGVTPGRYSSAVSRGHQLDLL